MSSRSHNIPQHINVCHNFTIYILAVEEVFGNKQTFETIFANI